MKRLKVVVNLFNEMGINFGVNGVWLEGRFQVVIITKGLGEERTVLHLTVQESRKGVLVALLVLPVAL